MFLIPTLLSNEKEILPFLPFFVVTIITPFAPLFPYMASDALNRLTINNHQGVVATISPISFFDLDELVTTRSSKVFQFL